MKTLKKTKRLIFSAFALLLSMTLTITSTYAWFTRSAQAEISGLDFEAISESDSLLISLNQGATEADWQTLTGYSASITSADFSLELETILDKQMGAFTTSDGVNFRDEAGGAATQSDENGYVISFNIRFRSETAVSVKLANGTHITPKDSDDTSMLKPVYAWGDDANLNTTNFAMKNYLGTQVTSIPVDSPIVTSSMYAARFSFNNGTTTKIWNPQESTHYDNGGGDVSQEFYNGIKDTRLIVDNDPTAFQLMYYYFEDGATSNFAVAYKNEIMSTSDVASPPATNAVSVNSTSLVTLAESSVSENPFFYGTLKVSVWLEGWDNSCFNAILGDTFTSILKFTTV